MFLYELINPLKHSLKKHRCKFEIDKECNWLEITGTKPFGYYSIILKCEMTTTISKTLQVYLFQ